MRWTIPLFAALALAACDSGRVPTPEEQQRLRPPSPQVEEGAVELRADGLSAGTEAFYFAAGRSEVEAALTGILGEPTQRGSNPECGAGPIDFTEFPGGITVNFQKGSMAGWLWRAIEGGEAPSTAKLSVPGDVQVGTPRAEAEAARGFAMIEQSTLDGEFSYGEKLGGIVDEERVTILYAGIQCAFR